MAIDPPNQNASFLTLAQFAQLSNLSPATLYRRIRDGHLATFQPGGKGTSLRIPASELQRLTTPASLSPTLPVQPLKAQQQLLQTSLGQAGNLSPTPELPPKRRNPPRWRK